MGWKDRIKAVGYEEAGFESKMARVILKAMGASEKDVGNLCRQFGIEYEENASPFRRAVNIMKCVYSRADGFTFDAVLCSGCKSSALEKEILESYPVNSIVMTQWRSNPEVVVVYAKIMDGDNPWIVAPGAYLVGEALPARLWMYTEPMKILKTFNERRNEDAQG